LTPSFRQNVTITEQVRLVPRRCPLRNFGQDTDYSDRAFRRFLQALQANVGVVSRGHNSFLPVPLLFITVSAFINLPATTWLQFFSKILSTTGFPQAPITNINCQMQISRWDRTDSLASRLRAPGSGDRIATEAKISVLSNTPRLTPRPTKLPTQWVPVFFLGGNKDGACS